MARLPHPWIRDTSAATSQVRRLCYHGREDQETMGQDGAEGMAQPLPGCSLRKTMVTWGNLSQAGWVLQPPPSDTGDDGEIDTLCFSFPGKGAAQSGLGLRTPGLRIPGRGPADGRDRTWAGRRVPGTEGPPGNRCRWKGQSSDGAPALDCGKEGGPSGP